MPSLEEWQNALDFPRRVTVDSTDYLAQTVNSRPNQSHSTEIPRTHKGYLNFPLRGQFSFGPLSYVINLFLVIWVLMSWMGLKFLFFTIGKFLGEK